MAFCSSCGKQVGDGTRFCPSCGAGMGGAQQQAPVYQPPVYQQQAGSAGDRDAADNKAMGILAYLGILVLVPIFAAKESRFARYHANQGVVLIIGEIAYMIIQLVLNAIFFAISWRLALIVNTVLGLLWFGVLAFIIIGIINAAGGKMKPLPIIGGITILK